ncbi:MAG: carboxylesterase family protein [Bacteroidales bacterium]|nr:carboxylesterase family protein [Bacteroidales bacterium]
MSIYRGIQYALAGRFSQPILSSRLSSLSEIEGKPIICPQNPSRLDAVLGGFVSDETQGEDCLRLSVYTPDTEGIHPVLVWIHGGAYLTGSGLFQKYSCEDLSKRGNIVVVSISYRLGALGFLYDKEKGIENLGLQDQVCALHWVKENIELFGGDPEDVTLMGQSAGAYSILNHIATVKEPLFKKAILFSSPFINGSRKMVGNISRKFLKVLGKDMMEASVEEILTSQAFIEKSSFGMPFSSVNEAILSPKSITPSLETVVLFCQKHDARPFFPVRPIAAILTSVLFRKPMFRYASFLRSKGVKASAGVLSWREDSKAGAVHCTELPLLFGSWNDWKDAPFMEGVSEEEFQQKSDLLKKIVIDIVNN